MCTAGGAVSAGLVFGGRPRRLGVVVGGASLSARAGEAGVPGPDLGDLPTADPAPAYIASSCSLSSSLAFAFAAALRLTAGLGVLRGDFPAGDFGPGDLPGDLAGDVAGDLAALLGLGL